MIRKYHVFAKWRKRDVLYLTSHDINVEEGYHSFLINEGDKFDKIVSFFTRNGFLKSSPPEFSYTQTPSEFSKEELDDSFNYVLNNLGYPKGYPLPGQDFKKILNTTYASVCIKCGSCRDQIAPFRIKSEPNWTGKTKLNFSLNWIFDETFIRKDIFQEVFEPLGLKSREVIIHKTGKAAETVVQLIIPEAKSKLELEGSSYDTQDPCSLCGIKKYDQRNIDFMPPFKEDFDFIICKTQESFGQTNTYMASRKIIINKNFCRLLLDKEMIEYDSNNLTPMLSK